MNTKTLRSLDRFTLAYLECALWSSTDDEGSPLDDQYGLDDLAPETLSRIVADCEAFQEANAEFIGSRLSLAGHDFWLTRCGHGAGFWDGDWPERGDELTEASKAFGDVNLYVGDDGRIYC